MKSNFLEYLKETKLTSLKGISKSLRMKLNFFMKKLNIEVKEITDLGNKLRIEFVNQDDIKKLKPYLDKSEVKIVKQIKNVIFISS
jgi:DNA polymerase/3'-5' exonuclease PolX